MAAAPAVHGTARKDRDHGEYAPSCHSVVCGRAPGLAVDRTGEQRAVVEEEDIRICAAPNGVGLCAAEFEEVVLYTALQDLEAGEIDRHRAVVRDPRCAALHDGQARFVILARIR